MRDGSWLLTAQKVAHGGAFWTLEGWIWIFSGADGASIRMLGLVTVGVWPMVEVEHPSVRPSAIGAAQKVARGAKLGNAFGERVELRKSRVETGCQ